VFILLSVLTDFSFDTVSWYTRIGTSIRVPSYLFQIALHSSLPFPCPFSIGYTESSYRSRLWCFLAFVLLKDNLQFLLDC